MVQVHTDEHEFADDLDRLESQVMQEEAADEVHVWESDRSHYHGRSNGEAHIGLSSEELGEVESAAGQELVDYVLAHELGHDLHHEVFGLHSENLKPETNVSDGELKYEDGNEDIDSFEEIPSTLTDIVTGEMIAELAGEENTSVRDPLQREPFPDSGENMSEEVEEYQNRSFYAEKGSEKVEALRNTDYRDSELEEIIDDLPYDDFHVFNFHDGENFTGGVEGFIENEGEVRPHQKYESDNGVKDDWDQLSYHLNMMKTVNEGINREDIDMKDVVKMAWSQEARNHVRIDTKENVLFHEIDSRLKDFDYMEEIEGSQRDVYESQTQVDRVIDQEFEGIMYNVVERSIEKAEEAIDEISEGYNSSTPSFGHMTSEMDSNAVGDDISFDYGHKVGCTLGQLLDENGVGLEDVRDNPEQYRNLAHQAMEEATRIGHQYNQTGIEPEREDFEQAMNYVIEEEIAG